MEAEVVVSMSNSEGTHRQRVQPVTRQTDPPIRKDTPWQQYRNCLNYSQNMVTSLTGAQCQD